MVSNGVWLGFCCLFCCLCVVVDNKQTPTHTHTINMLWWLLVTVALVTSTTTKAETTSSIPRDHTSECPLGINGPGTTNATTNFFEQPTARPEGAVAGACGFGGGDLTCCTEDYFTTAEGADIIENPFYASASSLFSDYVSGDCSRSLRDVSCGVCRSHEDSFVQSYTSLSEMRLCLSFCENLLGLCADETVGDDVPVSTRYADDAAGFCHDLYANVDNVKVSVVDDSLNRQCFSQAPECTHEDFTAFYTECDHDQTTRSVYYDYLESSSCRAGEPLPDPITDLPCHQTCPAGEFLPIGGRTCEKCPAGTHTVPGFYNDLWKDWPTEFNFKTYCEKNNGYSHETGSPIVEGDCQGWVLNDTFTESGDSTGDSQQSVLELSVYLVLDGYVEFEYKVLSEPRFDGLLLVVDGVTVMDLQSQILDWKVFRSDLTAGHHTLKWIYFKDISASNSLDMAMIDKIAIIGTKWADNECDICSFGHFSEEGSQLCEKCPMNTYSDAYGLPECLPCDVSEYSGIGAVSCLPRPDCTDADYTAAYTPCVEGSREKYYQMTEPIICHVADFTLPPNETIACGDCNPGMYRPEGSSECEFCPPGFHASEPGAVGSCEACLAGNYARKAQQYTVFESWSDLPLTPSCVGDCATPQGWRLEYSSIDSGVGHGTSVDVSLEIEFETDSYGRVEWFHEIKCSHMCRFQTVDVGESGGTRTYYGSMFSQGIYKKFHPITPGHHIFRWIFTKQDEYGTNGMPEDRLIIHNFTITGVTEGGSISCEPCEAGTFSDDAAEFCSECPKGRFSLQGAEECTLCPEGTFSKEKGSESCTECGPNTVSLSDRTGCDYNGCSYSMDGEEGDAIVYDISALEIPEGQDIYGPIRDKNDHIYYLNPCTTKHNNNSCYGSDGKPLETHACQLLGSPYDFYVDLGNVQGFLPLEDTSLAEDLERSGFILTMTSGNPGPECGNRPRSTNVTFLCNPSAGIGFPVGIEPVEAPPCFYNFMWASLYGCPVCSKSDYVENYGQCIGGVQVITYVPKTYPRRCHGGEAPPSPQTIPCESTSEDCPPGTYLPFLADECSPVPAGFYSIGGGVVIETFQEDYLSPVINPASTWGYLGDFARSGAGDTAFIIDVFLVQAGYVQFEYKVVAPGLDPTFEGGFTFSIDGDQISTIYRYSTDYKYVTYTLPLRSGDHTLQWKFTQGTVPSKEARGNYAIIDSINIYGTDRAARSPVPCKAGFYQDEEGHDSCKPCPTDTMSEAGSSSCTPCSEDHFSLPGSAQCEIREPCDQSDFVVKYTECNENKRTMYYVPLQPQTCQLTRDDLFDDNKTVVDCPSCLEGYTKVEENCTPCPLGQYWVDDACTTSPPGTRTKLFKSYVPVETEILVSETRQEEEQEEEPWWASYSSDLPEGFSTFSTGDFGSTGWRIVNNSLDSGFHSIAEADSVLVLNATLVQSGSISFTYELVSHIKRTDVHSFYLDGLEFLINGELQDAVIYHPGKSEVLRASFDLEVASLSPKQFIFEWVYHQPAASQQHNSIVLSEIEVYGDSTGTSLEVIECDPGTAASNEEGSVICSPCSPGYYSSMPAAPACDICEAVVGLFSDEPGATSCQECGAGTVSNGESCSLSDCVFTDTEGQSSFDLSTLSQFIEFEDPDSTGLRYELSLCDKIPPLSTNCFVDETPLNTFACAKNKSTGASFSTGNLANVEFQYQGSTPQLLMRYDHGAPCKGTNYFTEITFICDSNVTSPSEGIEFVGQFECLTKVEWSNIAACPLCQESDYKKQVTECQDSQQSITWIKATNCSGPEILRSETQTCHDYTIPIAVLSVAIFIALIFAIIVIYIRNRKLAERYEMLVQESTRRASGPAKENPGWENDTDNEKL